MNGADAKTRRPQDAIVRSQPLRARS